MATTSARSTGTTRRVGRRKSNNFVPRLQTLASMLLIAAVALLVRELLLFSNQEERIPNQVIVAGINVGGMTPAEARAAWAQAYSQPVTLYYDTSPILLDPIRIGFRENWETMLANAIGAGEVQGNFWTRFFNHLTQEELTAQVSLPLSADYQRGLLEEFLLDVARRYDRPPSNAGFDTQTLTTFVGQRGLSLDIDLALEQIDAALRDPLNRTVILPTGNTDSGLPTLETLRELIIAYLDAQGFIYDSSSTIASVFIMDLTTGEELNILGDVAFTAASTVKVGIMVNFFRSISRDPTQDEAWLLANSLLCSRNASSNLLIDLAAGEGDIFTGLTQVSQTMQYIGARNSYLSAPFVEGVAGQQLGSVAPPTTNPNRNFSTAPDPYNQTTAEDMATMFALLYDCANYDSGLALAYPAGEIDQRECRRMLELMSANDLERLLQGGIPQGVRISHKNGWLAGVVGDAGIVYPPNGRDYVIAVFLWEDTDFQDFTRLWPLVEGISRAAWNHFNPEQSLLNPRILPPTAMDCEGNYLPPAGQVNLDNINAWRQNNGG